MATLVRDFECRTMERAKELLGPRMSRTVCNNTVLEKRMSDDRTHVESVSLLLHGHEIARWEQDGDILRLWSRGHRTVTTKDRINRVLPPKVSLYQKDGQWVVRDRREHPLMQPDPGVTVKAVRVMFHEGMALMVKHAGILFP